MTAQLVMDALLMAIFRRGRPRTVLHHSDQEVQYTSEDSRGYSNHTALFAAPIVSPPGLCSATRSISILFRVRTRYVRRRHVSKNF